MITQKMIDQWRAEDAQGNGIGAGDDDHQVFDIAEAVDTIRAEYPEMQVLATEAHNGARVLCRDGEDLVLFMNKNGMWGQSVTVDGDSDGQ